MARVKLIALDLDGTLLNSQKEISEKDKIAIRKATDAGVHIVISTGRPYIGVPFDMIKGTGIDYAITTNGAAIYEISTDKCIISDPMSQELALPAINYVLERDIHMDAFIEGLAYSPLKCLDAGRRLPYEDIIKNYILGDSRKRVDDLIAFIKDNNHLIQKCTLNFVEDETTPGKLKHRDEVKEYLESSGKYSVVCGGYNNLEFTKAGIDKGVGLIRLAEYLNLPVEATMAIGDSENDLSILKAAGVGVAMGNSSEEILAIADYVTLSNDESGVAAAIEHFLAM